MTTTVALLACLASTLYMTGLIWFVQRVHYPLLGELGGAFERYHRLHVRRTGPVVFGAMVTELATAALLVAMPPPGVPRRLAAVGLAAAGVTWLSTALLQVPRHRRLAGGYDPATLRSLVRTNWVRTAAWTAHAAIALAMTAQALG